MTATTAALLMMAEAGAFAQSTPGEAAPKALPFVSPIFGDNMVLQRGKPDAIWGWSDPGDTVRVQIGEHSATATAGPDRRWLVRIQPPALGGLYTVKITGHQTVELHNVLVGDVWLRGGQSNMGVVSENRNERWKCHWGARSRLGGNSATRIYMPILIGPGEIPVLGAATFFGWSDD